MATLVVNGLIELENDFSKIAEIPDSVMENMINAETDVIVAAQKKKAKTMLRGKYNRGYVERAIKKKKFKRSYFGASQMITIDGTVTDEYHRKPTRVAEIAFINEYGKEGQPARPFIRTANEESGDKAVQAAFDVYDQFLKSKNL